MLQVLFSFVYIICVKSSVNFQLFENDGSETKSYSWNVGQSKVNENGK